MSQPSSVAFEVVMNYVAGDVERYRVYQYPAPEGEPQVTTEIAKRTVPMFDGRVLTPELEREGVALVSHRTAVADLFDEAAIRSLYYPEMEALVRLHTGAAKTYAFDHNLRYAPLAVAGERGIQAPIRFVHNDYTEKSGPQRVRDLLPDEASDLLGGRCAVINVWKPIEGPVEENPLAVCDATSMRQRDFIPTDLVYRERTGEIYSVAYSEGHRWIYFPEMRADEAMLLKCYDSDTDGRSRFTAHSAFVDPHSKEDAAPRKSIEVRVLAFFEG